MRVTGVAAGLQGSLRVGRSQVLATSARLASSASGMGCGSVVYGGEAQSRVICCVLAQKKIVCLGHNHVEH